MCVETHVIICSRAGIRLDACAAAESGLTRSRIAGLIGQGAVTVNDRTVTKPGVKLQVSDRIVLRVPPPAPTELIAQNIPLKIIYEDRDLLVIDKPVGLVVHPSAGHDQGTLVNALLHHCGDLSGIGGSMRPGIVHRLDKDTSGALVVAKNDAAHTALTAAFARGDVLRCYIAWVEGRFSSDTIAGTIEAPIGRHPKNRKKMAVVSGERYACTRWQVLLATPKRALVACRLLTGRTHQIRVHMAHIGHPVDGDPVYGRGAVGSHQLLHGWRIGFEHPSSQVFLRFETDLPEWVPAPKHWERPLDLGEDCVQ